MIYTKVFIIAKRIATISLSQHYNAISMHGGEGNRKITIERRQTDVMDRSHCEKPGDNASFFVNAFTV